MDEDSEHLAKHQPTAADNTQDPDEFDRSSPWTIEAVDESDTNELSSYVSLTLLPRIDLLLSLNGD